MTTRPGPPSEPPGQPGDHAGSQPGTPWQFVAPVGAMVAVAAHLPVTPEHLSEAPYMGVLFVAFSLVTLAVAAAILLRATPEWYVLLTAVNLAAVATYAATRLVAFPLLDDDVGNWAEPLGVLAVLAEIFTAVACLLRLSTDRRGRRGAALPEPGPGAPSDADRPLEPPSTAQAGGAPAAAQSP